MKNLVTLVCIINAIGTFGGKVALRLVGPEVHHTLTYSEPSREVNQLSRALAADGHRFGERIGLMAPTCLDWFLVAYAIHAQGFTDIEWSVRRALAHQAVSSLAVGASILQKGDRLVWFPEGRRSPDGGLQPFKSGIGLLLEHFSVPVVPLAILGTFDALPTEKTLPHLVPIKVIFGKPMSADELAGRGSGQHHHERITSGLRQVIQGLGNLKEQV